MRRLFLVLVLLLGASATRPAIAEQVLEAVPVQEAPMIDGTDLDAAWQSAAPVVSRDLVAGIEVTLKAVYTADEVFVLVQFPDQTVNRSHKMLRWNDALQLYEIGPAREDTFVLKWSMEPDVVDLSLSSDRSYTADIWYWKANRTDHAGHADDKVQRYSLAEIPRAKRLLSKSGRLFYLTRSGDKGSPAYEVLVYGEHIGDQVPMYLYHMPQGSRADVRARGKWEDGIWTIEFGRRLITGHQDDVQFTRNQTHQFGISRFEIAGRRPDPNIDEPNFGSGEVGETLFLAFR